MKRRSSHLALGAAAFAAASLLCSAAADPIDLSTWTAESYPAVDGFLPGEWKLENGNTVVRQNNNGQPTVFYSDFNAMGTVIRGLVRVDTTADDDYFGFVVGFNPGDADPGNLAADYLLIDWKQNDQFFNFGPPSDITPGGTAFRGLAVSRVTGIPTADEFWQHTDYETENPNGGLTELARGNTLGDVAWVDFQEYLFEIIFEADRLRVWVDGVLEIDINGSFADGRVGFYNFSQEQVVYSAFTVEDLAGCSLGFWKQPHHFAHWVDYDPDDLFCDVFDCSTPASMDAYGGKTLHEVLSQGGGQLRALGRQAVAALLNATSSVEYPLSEAEVIDAVNDAIASEDHAEIEALKDELDEMNNLGCPLPNTADLNWDGHVDVSDLLDLISNWGPCQYPHICPADINGDGRVGMADLLMIFDNWGHRPAVWTPHVPRSVDSLR
jgi:hypothetical protein